LPAGYAHGYKKKNKKDEMKEENKIKDTAEAIKGVVEAVPIYQDLAQPAVQEVGKGLHTISKTIHVALAPISALVWGYDQIKDFVSTRVAEKLKNIDETKITTPNPTVAGPALEALRYTGHQESLRELYANLLASSLNVDSAKNVHPAFVDMIKNMTSDEAKIMTFMATRVDYPLINTKAVLKNDNGFIYKLFHVSLIGKDSGCEHPHFAPNYLDNLCRMKLLEIPQEMYLVGDHLYDPIISHKQVQEDKKRWETNENIARYDIEKCKVTITGFGKQFARACILPLK
jgi:hypothetical protein